MRRDVRARLPAHGTVEHEEGDELLGRRHLGAVHAHARVRVERRVGRHERHGDAAGADAAFRAPIAQHAVPGERGRRAGQTGEHEQLHQPIAAEGGVEDGAEVHELQGVVQQVDG